METKINLANLGKSIYLLKPSINDNDDSINTITKPRYVNKVLPADRGLQLHTPAPFTVPFLSMNYISVFGLGKSKDPELFVDLYTARRNYGFRIPMETICYQQFFSKKHYYIQENFRVFIMNMLKQCQPVFIDEPTAAYLQGRIAWIYKDPDESHVYSRTIWIQIMSRKKILCGHCSKIVWEDIREKALIKCCGKCNGKKKETKDPRVLFARYLSNCGLRGAELGDKLYKLVRLEQWLNGKPLHSAGREHITGFLEQLSDSGKDTDEIQAYRNLIVEYYQFCNDIGCETSYKWNTQPEFKKKKIQYTPAKIKPVEKKVQNRSNVERKSIRKGNEYTEIGSLAVVSESVFAEIPSSPETDSPTKRMKVLKIGNVRKYNRDKGGNGNSRIKKVLQFLKNKR